MTDVDVVVGAGHNGLVAACYLAQQGRERPARHPDRRAAAARLEPRLDGKKGEGGSRATEAGVPERGQDLCFGRICLRAVRGDEDPQLTAGSAAQADDDRLVAGIACPLEAEDLDDLGVGGDHTLTATITNEGRRLRGDMEVACEPAPLQERNRLRDRQFLISHAHQPSVPERGAHLAPTSSGSANPLLAGLEGDAAAPPHELIPLGDDPHAGNERLGWQTASRVSVSRDFMTAHQEALVALITATIPLLLFWAKRLAYRDRAWLRANSEKRDSLGMAFVILGFSGRLASGPLLDGWSEALFLNLGVSFITVGSIEIVIMSAVEGERS